jgi:DNA mismatch endonuclease (patch repair protein)
MVDVVSPEVRSRMMSGIRAKNTKPEILVRRALHALGFRYRLHDRKLPGHPDIVLPRYGAVVFIHGCFWHGHDCRLFKVPATRPEFWLPKIERNRANDTKHQLMLAAMGWRIAVVWECALRGRQAQIDDVAGRLAHWLPESSARIEIRG